MNVAKWLDHSADANAIALVLNDSYSFYELYSELEQADNDNAAMLHKLVPTIQTDETLRGMLFDLVREVWDAAYSYGYHDANAENGLTLDEMED